MNTYRIPTELELKQLRTKGVGWAQIASKFGMTTQHLIKIRRELGLEIHKWNRKP